MSARTFSRNWLIARSIAELLASTMKPADMPSIFSVIWGLTELTLGHILSGMASGRERLTQWIKRSRLKQIDAAGELGMDQSYLSRVLSGKQRPGLDTAAKIEQVTGIPTLAWASTAQDTPAAVTTDVAVSRDMDKS